MRISDWSSDVCSSDLPSTNAVSVRAFEQAFAHADDSRAMPVPYLVKEGLDYPGMPTRYGTRALAEDRKSTRLNSITNAHLVCRLLLEKKNQHKPASHSPNIQIILHKATTTIIKY